MYSFSLRGAICAGLATALCVLAAQAQSSRRNLSTMAEPPDWSRLDRFQETITRADFEKLLTRVYAPMQTSETFIQIDQTHALIDTYDGGTYTLRFASSTDEQKPVPRTWKVLRKFRSPDPEKPLLGLTIAIDPGHIGGKYAQIEERWFQIGNAPPVQEGDMVLKVAKIMTPALEKLGAKVVLLRESNEPVTHDRPDKLRTLARAELKKLGVSNIIENYTGRNDPRKSRTVQNMSEVLFYRASEIRARGQLVEKLAPDMVLCLHFNAEGWGRADRPSLTDVSHFHILINGTYSKGELNLEDVRFEMLEKLLGRAYYDEVALADVIAPIMARDNRLPPFTYRGSNASKVGQSPYVWARNLLANRLYDCPTFFLEPYVMNNKLDYKRIQMGDYEGTKVIDGISRKSIYREYADSLVESLRVFFTGTH